MLKGEHSAILLNFIKLLLEHSAILLTFINLPFVIKILVLSTFEWPFYTGFTVPWWGEQWLSGRVPDLRPKFRASPASLRSGP